LNADGREIFDISPLINRSVAVFPGDTPFEEHFAMEMSKGHNLTLSHIKTTVHLGAHTDAPNHYLPKGAGMEQRSLDYYLGPCQVVEVSVGRGERIGLSAIRNIDIKAPRVLFKTGTFPDPWKWNGDFASLSAELVNDLAKKGVRLVGIDTPSIDLAEDKILESHQAVGKNDMAILEGIVLDKVNPGLYDLIALPLKIEGADGSPVRAVLLK
jgi:arylformamidase